jgi:hypothetical protein
MQSFICELMRDAYFFQFLALLERKNSKKRQGEKFLKTLAA